MSRVNTIFQKIKPIVIGMIHVQALPGTPNNILPLASIVNKACEEAELYSECNVDSVLIENMHDVPYVTSNSIGPEIISSMTKICSEVRKILPANIKCGIQILAGANKEALAVAQASELQFIRAEGFIYSHIADEGLMNSCAGELLRFRKLIGAENVAIFTDIKKKHCSHSITDDMSLEEMAKAAEFFNSDGIILTGKSTGDPVISNDFKQVKRTSCLPILIGSGVTIDNVKNFLEADALIVGSHFKKSGLWKNEIEKERVQKFMETIRKEKKF